MVVVRLLSVRMSLLRALLPSITDFDGNFVLDNVPDNAVLQISYIGYRTLDVPVSGKSSLNIKLEEDSEKLEEVVVVGYGTQKKGEITSSVTSVKAEDFNKIPVVNPMSLVEGRVAGLTISRAGTDRMGRLISSCVALPL